MKKMDFVEGFYYLRRIGDKYRLSHYSSLTGDPTGDDGMNVEFVQKEGTLEEVKKEMRRVRRIIWVGRDHYLSQKDIKSFGGILIVP